MNPAPCSFTPGEHKPFIRLQRHSTCQISADAQIGVDHSDPLRDFDLGLPVLQGHLVSDFQQSPGPPAAFSTDSHRDAHRSRVGGIDPGMIGDRERYRNAGDVLKMRLHDPAVECLRQRIGRDQAETPGPARGNLLRGTVPPIHHVIGRLRQLPVTVPQRFRIAVA